MEHTYLNPNPFLDLQIAHSVQQSEEMDQWSLYRRRLETRISILLSVDASTSHHSVPISSAVPVKYADENQLELSALQW